MSEAPLLEVRDLWKRFAAPDGSTIEVLKGINFEIATAERVAILGPSGVGKSTLLHILGTLDRPSRGTLRFRGEDVFDRDTDALAEFRSTQLGFVFQFHHLLPEFSAEENVMMPGLLRGDAHSEIGVRAREILDAVGLSHRLDQPVGKLSGGERQRVALARALVLDPPLLLADEPTGNLDPETAAQIDALLLELNRSRGTALVVVTHNPTLASHMGRSITLEL